MGRRTQQDMNRLLRERAGRTPATGPTRAATTKGAPAAKKDAVVKTAAKGSPREDVEERPAAVPDLEAVLEEVGAIDAEALPAEIEAVEEDLAGVEEEAEEIRNRRDEGLARAAAMRARLDALDAVGDEDGGEE